MSAIINSGQILANTVILSRATEKNKTALLIEGDKDGRIYKKVVDSSLCRTFPAGNRLMAEQALAILKAETQKGVLAIVDADTDHIMKRGSADPDLLITHTRDAEGILLQSSALRNVLIEFDIDGVFGPSPEKAVIEAVAPLGYLRFIAETKKWTVRMSSLDFGQFIDPGSLECNTRQLCRHMAYLTITPGVNAAQYESVITVLMTDGHSPSTVARGHDATALLAWAIPIAAGKKRRYGALITGDVVESYLRTAYSADAFRTCKLHKQIQEWETKNAPFRVLTR